MIRYFFFLLTVLSVSSCSKEPAFDTVLYSNEFDNASDLDDFEIGFGQIAVTPDESADQSAGCLEIFGWCATPNLTMELGPFDKNYNIRLESWVKTDYGAAIHLNIDSNSNDHVSIQTKEDLFKARKWNHYTSDALTVPKGEKFQLWVDASNQTLSFTWIDGLEIMAEEY